MRHKFLLAGVCVLCSLAVLYVVVARGESWRRRGGAAAEPFTGSPATGSSSESASPGGPASETPAGNDELVRRGEYLVAIIGCDDCHTPWVLGPAGPSPDMSRRLSGHPQRDVTPPAPVPVDGTWVWYGAASNTAFAGPWGVSYAFNLTPEMQTGIGVWTEEIFTETIRNGRHWGVARPILPPMPWQNYRNMTDEDLAAIFAYLRTLPPVVNQVPQAVVAPAPDPAG